MPKKQAFKTVVEKVPYWDVIVSKKDLGPLADALKSFAQFENVLKLDLGKGPKGEGTNILKITSPCWETLHQAVGFCWGWLEEKK